MSSLFLSQDIVDPENVTSSACNDFLTFIAPYKYIVSGDYSLDDTIYNQSIDQTVNQQISMHVNYSEILDQLASSLDSPTKFKEFGRGTDHSHSSYLPHQNESKLENSTNDHKQILMSSSTDTLYESPKELLNTQKKADIYSDSDNTFFKCSIYGLQSTDSNNTKYVCPIDGCGKVFTRKANRRAHIETHNPHRARPFSCKVCSKSYLRSIDLMRHMETTHDKTQKHLCDFCGRTFTRKEGLKKHQNRGVCSFIN